MSAASSNLPIQLLHDRVLVQEEGPNGERKSTGGIVIPVTAQAEKPLVWAELVGVGPNVRNVLDGDRVLFDAEDRGEVENFTVPRMSCYASATFTRSLRLEWRVLPGCTSKPASASNELCQSDVMLVAFGTGVLLGGFVAAQVGPVSLLYPDSDPIGISCRCCHRYGRGGR